MKCKQEIECLLWLQKRPQQNFFLWIEVICSVFVTLKLWINKTQEAIESSRRQSNQNWTYRINFWDEMFIRAKICYFVYICKEKSTVNVQVERCFFGGPGNCYTHTRLAMPNLVSIYADFEILDGWMPFRLKNMGQRLYLVTNSNFFWHQYNKIWTAELILTIMAPLSSFCIELPALYSKTSKKEQLLPKCSMQLLLISFHPYALALLETKPDTHFSLYCTAPLETGFFIIDILQILTLYDSRHF